MPTCNEELQMLRDSAARVAEDVTARGIPVVRDLDEVWSQAADLGWLALPFEEADGGLGGGAVELCTLTRELGRSLLVGSFVLGTVLPGRLVAAAPPGELRTRLLEALLTGTRSLALADAETATRGACPAVSLRALPQGDGWRLEGAKAGIWIGDETRELLVSAIAGPPGSAELLLVVPVDAPGLELRAFETIDGGRGADAILSGVTVPATAVLIPPAAEVRALREAAWDLACVASMAECIGIMKALLHRTTEYLHTRKQFNQPLSKFQVLRHRMADMALACRRAEVLTESVAEHFGAMAPAERTRAVVAACIKGLEGARYVCEQSIQLHGGMGMTAELPLGRYLRRIVALQATLGFPEYQRARFQSTGGG
jgi:alkylation response protein AidB-like acyl-CoA dehydrogenase